MASRQQPTEATARTAVAAPTRVGLFVIRGEPIPPTSHILAHSLVQATGRGGGTGRAHSGLKLHILLGPSYDFEDFDLDVWHQRLGAAAPLLGGLHLCRQRNHLTPYASAGRQQGNYLHKSWSMVAISAMLGYEFILSTDDDVLIPPLSLRAFLSASHVPPSGLSPYAAKGCGVLLPALSNGVPNAEHFAQAALPPSARQLLDECYSGSRLSKLPGMRFGPMRTRWLNAQIRPWDARQWYDSVRHNVSGVYKGIHPVRANGTCMALSLQLALQHLDDWWSERAGRGPAEKTAPAIESFGPRAHETHGPFPYFTNTLWMSAASVYGEALRRLDLFVDSFDEVPMNRCSASQTFTCLRAPLPSSAVLPC